MMKMTLFAKRIKALREEKGLTMEEFCKDFCIEVNKSTVSRWEKGKVEPYLSTAVELSKYYDVSLDYLIGLSDTRKPDGIKNKLIQILKEEHKTTDVAEIISDTLEKSTARAARRSSKPSKKLIARRQGAET